GLAPAPGLSGAHWRRAFTALEGTGDASARAWVLQAAALYGIGVGRWAEVQERRGGGGGVGGRDRPPARRPAAAGRDHRPAGLGAVLPGRAGRRVAGAGRAGPARPPERARRPPRPRRGARR